MMVVISLDTKRLTFNPNKSGPKMNTYSRLTASLAIAIGVVPLTANAGSCFVWRVTNTTAPCYLVGTMHALSAHDYPLPQGYYQALNDSKRLVFETKPYPPNEYFTKFIRAAT